MHPALKAIRAATLGTEFENELWLVGGAVRDEMLRIPHNADFDIVLRGSSADLAKFLYKKRISRIPPVTYERFGTAMVQIEDTQIELVTARRESYESGSRKPQVEPATLEEDALRRDFTVNTLMKNIHTDQLLDPLGKGLEDLDAKLLRTPLDPVATFHDDPLRILRAVRFRWKLGFEPVKGLYGAIKQEAQRLQIISGERIRDELIKMLLHPTAPRAIDDLMQLGLFDQFAPELVAMVGIDQGKYHHLDAWDHSVLVLENVIREENKGCDQLVLRLSALLHDIGKPDTQTRDEKGYAHTYDHEQVGAKIVEQLLRRLKFPVDDIDKIALLVRNHSRLGYGDTKLTAPATRRLIRDLGDLIPELLALVTADRSAHKEGVKHPDLKQAREMIEQVQQQTPRETLVSPLEGGEIMDLLKLPPGPQIGKWKNYLAELVIEGRLQPGDKQEAQAALLRAVAESTAS